MTNNALGGLLMAGDRNRDIDPIAIVASRKTADIGVEVGQRWLHTA